MKLPFEEWLTQLRPSKNVESLYTEAFICFRNSAYRASFLFSYLGLMTRLKELIIKSTKPALITQAYWDSLIKKLQNDDEWERAVYDALVNTKTPVFNISEDIRLQIKYWKDRRNDCAHFKSNEIESHHTESLWSFIKSNLLKITVEGGKESLLIKFEKHFDNTFTPIDADVSTLVKEIDITIDVSELTQFWTDLIVRVQVFPYLLPGKSQISEVFNKVFESSNLRTKENLGLYIKEKLVDLTILELYPDKIHCLNYSPAEIRQIWKSRILIHKSTAFSIFGTLLRNNLIPDSEVAEANQHIIDSITNYRPTNDSTHLALSRNGFGDLLFKLTFLEKRLFDYFHFANPRADMLAYYIEEYPLRTETVEVICEMYNRPKNAQWFRERLVNIFAVNGSKKQEFHSIVKSKGLTVPSELE